MTLRKIDFIPHAVFHYFDRPHRIALHPTGRGDTFDLRQLPIHLHHHSFGSKCLMQQW